MITVLQTRVDDGTVASVEWEKFDAESLNDANTITWIDLESPSREEENRVLNQAFHFHSLAIEDCRSKQHQPKVDDFPGYLFVIIRGILPKGESGEYGTERISAFLGDNFLVTYHESRIDSVAKTLSHCSLNAKALERGPDNIFHKIIDDMVDAYLPVLDFIDREIDSIEEKIFGRAGQKTLSHILALKKDVMHIRRVSTQQKEVLNRLSRGEFELINESERIYYRDVYDHLARIADLTETYRDLITGLLDAYLSVASNRMNEIMKTLTIISTIMLPLSLVAGIYGMNFQHMPELSWIYGYPFALSVMCIIAICFLIFFRRRKWF